MAGSVRPSPRVLDDRLKIWNPCVLPDGWTVQNLLGTHASAPFNPAIANVFFRSGEIETWGRGIERIFAACQSAGAPRPALSFDGTGLAIEFRYAPEYLRAISAAETPSPQLTPPVTPPVASPLAMLVRLLDAAGDLGNAAILKHLSLKDRTHLRERYLAPALAAGLIERTLPDKPNSRLQKYRLTAPRRRARAHSWPGWAGAGAMAPGSGYFAPPAARGGPGCADPTPATRRARRASVTRAFRPGRRAPDRRAQGHVPQRMFGQRFGQHGKVHPMVGCHSAGQLVSKICMSLHQRERTADQSRTLMGTGSAYCLFFLAVFALALSASPPPPPGKSAASFLGSNFASSCLVPAYFWSFARLVYSSGSVCSL